MKDALTYADVHAHISEDIFDADRKKILDECRKKGISIVNCSGTPESNRKALKLAKEFKELNICLGIYPIQCAEMSDREFFNELEFIKQNADKLAGIGEVGLDFYWIKDDEKRRREVERFREIIWLANKVKLPLNVHTRDATAESVSLLAQSAHVPVVLHSFVGEPAVADVAVKNGFYFSIPVNVIYNKKRQKLVESLPMGCILTETDCPYLGPDPKKRNDPLNIPLGVKKIAELKNIHEDETRRIILENARRVFRI
ncbi:MAG: TatD family hydrolase [Candidatus Nanoarchaeia archaeon]|nr:TatD family hydrolase [Candidatus Nanoarchaeia archaeon]MDD5239846.1 TatD family hydrolase [Candidatus Nanoarchaeia archaeon]